MTTNGDLSLLNGQGSNGVNGQHESHVGDTHPIPEPEAPGTFDSLKQRIRSHYEMASDYYYSLWGQHIHHGYFTSPDQSKEDAQVKLIDLLLDVSLLAEGSSVLDVGCGLGGTSRYLAKNHACSVTGITISGKQVQIARRLTAQEAVEDAKNTGDSAFVALGEGKVKFVEVDAEKMDKLFPAESFDCVWISEAMSHLPNKDLFFRNAARVLKSGGKLVVADWFKAEGLSSAQLEQDIKPIEDGMLLPPLCTATEYVEKAAAAGLETLSQPKDISKEVAKTWDISWSLIQNPSLWAFAISQGRDGLAFLQSFRAMRGGYSSGTFRYAVMAFVKS